MSLSQSHQTTNTPLKRPNTPMSLSQSHTVDLPYIDEQDMISPQTIPGIDLNQGTMTTNTNTSSFITTNNATTATTASLNNLSTDNTPYHSLFESFGPRGRAGSNSWNISQLLKSKSHGPTVPSPSPLNAHGTHFPFKSVYSLSRKDENEWESDISSSASKAHSQPTPYLWGIGKNNGNTSNNKGGFVVVGDGYLEREHSLSTKSMSQILNPPMTLHPSNTKLVNDQDEILPLTPRHDDSLLDMDDDDEEEEVSYIDQILGASFGIDEIDDDVLRINQEIEGFKLNRNLIVESLMDIYSQQNRCWITVGAILNRYSLYLVSAKQFKIYEEFMERTKYEEIIDEEDDDSSDSESDVAITVILEDKGREIEMKDAELMIKNMGIKVQDEDKEMELKHKIMDFLCGKTKFDIQRHILLNPNTITSLASLFGIDEIYIADIQSIRIHGFYNENVIPSVLREEFVDYMLADIIYTDQDVQGDCLVIMFDEYLYPVTVNEIRDRMYAFLDKKLPLLTEKQLSLLDIQPYYDGQILNATITDRIIICDLSKQYDYAEPFEMKQHSKYGFELKTDSMKVDNKQDEHTMTCMVNSNNLRHSWIAHLDYAIWHSRKPRNGDESDDDIKYDADGNPMPPMPCIGINDHLEKNSSKWTNASNAGDVLSANSGNNTDHTHITSDGDLDGFHSDDENENDEEKKKPQQAEFIKDFGFGMNFNYWIKGYQDSVNPVHDTLKRELMNNNIKKLDEEQYAYLYKKGLKLLKTEEVQRTFTAKYVGVNNKKFNVAKGSKMTINHLITMISYCDFTDLPCDFKKACRRLVDGESDYDFKRRNAEIANWCRYLKECCIFFGQNMSTEQRFYTGLDKKLIFKSLTQHFECPISTTEQRLIAEKFSDGSGIILQLKAGNDRTTYFDTTWLSVYDQEEERLIMGCSLIICDILFRNHENELCNCREWIYALRLFEKIINGHSFSWVNCLNRKKPTQIYLNHLIKYHKNETENKAPKYIIVLFENLCDKHLTTNKNTDGIWLNRSELNRLKHKKLRTSIYDFDKNECGEFFQKFNISSSDIRWIQEFEWKINGYRYQMFRHLKQRKYLSSKTYSYQLFDDKDDVKQQHQDNDNTILFNLTSCSKYSHEMEEVALFLEIQRLPKFINGIKISIERICKECNYQNIMMPQWLSLNPINLKESCGSRVFPTNKLENLTEITWLLAIKLLKIE